MFTHKHICVKSVTEIREAADAFLIWIGENRNDEGGNQAGERNENMSHTQHNHMHIYTHKHPQNTDTSHSTIGAYGYKCNKLGK